LLLNKVRIKVRDLLSDVVKQADWDLDKLLEVEVFVHRSWSSKIIVQHMREPDTMSFKVWCLARTGTTPHGRWWHMVIPFIIVAVFVSKNEGRRDVDDNGVVVQYGGKGDPC
jgi:hypothetical protein